MKVAIAGGRTVLVPADQLLDAGRASGGWIPAEPADVRAARPGLRRR